jgi:hypothetical protein
VIGRPTPTGFSGSIAAIASICAAVATGIFAIGSADGGAALTDQQANTRYDRFQIKLYFILEKRMG